jgi:hypothetical protein
LRDQFGVPLDECIGCSRAFALLADPKRPVAVTASASIPKVDIITCLSTVFENVGIHMVLDELIW